MFFVIEEATNTVLDCSQGALILILFFVLIQNDSI